VVQGSEPAHKLLELLIVKALVSGKTKEASVRLNIKDLATSFDMTAIDDVDLVIKIDLSWDEPIDYFEDLLTKDKEESKLS
jgi:hypothetical protein